MGYCLLWSGSVLVHTREGELTAFVFPAANRCLVGWFLLPPVASESPWRPADGLIVLFIVLGANSSRFICSAGALPGLLAPPPAWLQMVLNVFS